MKKHLKKALAATTFLCLTSCGGGLNTIGSKYFTEDGDYQEKVAVFKSQVPSGVRFYIEVSGSMNGFFRSNQATKFKNDVWSVITDFTPDDGTISVFTQQNAPAAEIPIDKFRVGMNQGAFVSSQSTDVPDMINRIINDINPKSNQVSVLISDMKYDPTGNAAIKALLTQYSTDIRNIMMRNPEVAICLIAAKSEFLNKNCENVSSDSPYYYLIAGNPQNVVFMRNFISTLLKHNKTFVDEIEFGIDYLAPSIKVSDEDYLTNYDVNSYGDFDEECTITLDFDITAFPWMYENKDSLANHIVISSQEGTDAKIITKKIKYDIKYDDGKVLKRTAIAKVPIHITNMYEESDVFEIKLTCPEIQIPNKAFASYLGSEDPNDPTMTFSMENLLAGFYSSMPRFREAKPVHLLISKK